MHLLIPALSLLAFLATNSSRARTSHHSLRPVHHVYLLHDTMPTYLLHGFRWPRPLIRIHIILQNIDDAAPEWLCSPQTTRCLVANFHDLFPESMPHLPNLRFIEQYDPADLSPSALSQPFAYVADVVEEVKLGVDIDDVRGRGVSNDQWGALMEVRDRLAPDEKVGWWVVVCGDEERLVPPKHDRAAGFAINQTTQLDRSEQEGLGIRGADYTNGHGNAFKHGNGNGHVRQQSSTQCTDPGLRELREQIGYRTESDASDYSSSGAPRPRTAGSLGTPRVDSIEDAASSPSSPKKSGVRKWLSKRKRYVDAASVS